MIGRGCCPVIDMHATADLHVQRCHLRNRTQNLKRLAGYFGDLLDANCQSAIGMRSP